MMQDKCFFRKYKDSILLSVIVLLSAVFSLLLCSKCSPVYPFNDWYDLNIFFTIGKGMTQGKVLYAELMDHKGPYVYAVYALGYLLSKKDFTGVFLIEIICMSIFLICTWKIIKLYTQKKWTGIWMLPVLASGIAISKSFVHGGSLEELTIWIYAYAVYGILRVFKSKDVSDRDESAEISWWSILINGVLAGVLFWSKFTLTGIYIGWIIVKCGVYLKNREIKRCVKTVGYFGLGAIIATMPWILYFGMNRQIFTWIKIYIYDNIWGYSSLDGSKSILDMIQGALELVFRSLLDLHNLPYSILLIVGCAFFCIFPSTRIGLAERVAVVFLFVCAAMGIFIGGVEQDYYGLPLAAFSTFGVLMISVLQEKVEQLCMKKRKVGSTTKWFNRGLTVCTICLSILLGYRFSSNRYLLQYEKADMPQYRFADIIQQSEDTSLLNYGFMDGGFYTVLGQVPQQRYFCTINMNWEAVRAEQNEYLQQGLTQWVVYWKEMAVDSGVLKEIPVLSEYYDLVDYMYFPVEGGNRTYALYKKR